MIRRVLTAMLAIGLLALGTPASAVGEDPSVELSLEGKPYSGGLLALHVTATGSGGAVPFLVVGIQPLVSPIATGKGPLHVGTVLWVLSLPALPVDGGLDLPVLMPTVLPSQQGIPLALQVLVDGALSNPATLPLDPPSFTSSQVLPNPMPTTGANFGDRIEAGDLNDDGHVDLVVGAWFEDFQGIEKSGRVYVLWGPDQQLVTTLEPASPKSYGKFGGGLVVADLDGDLVDDLVVAEAAGYPLSGEPGHLHVYLGSQGLGSPTFSVDSLGTSVEYSGFGRSMAAGDFDGDGACDLAVGIALADAGASQSGRIDVYWGPTFTAVTEVLNPDPSEDDFFGTSLGAADLSGDGTADLLEGSGRYDVGGVLNVGRAHVFSLLNRSEALLATIDNPVQGFSNQQFGEPVLGDDLDGDGDLEFITARDGEVLIFEGPDYATHRIVSVEGASGAFGDFTIAEDVNADGILDLVISDYFTGIAQGCSPLPMEGRLFLALGPFHSTIHVIEHPNPECGDEFSWGGGLPVQLDADPPLELVVPAEGVDQGAQNAGVLYVFDGPGDG